MKRPDLLVVILLPLLLLTSCTSAPSPAPLPSSVAKAYLTTVLDFIEQNSLMKKNVDWSGERQLAFHLAQYARTTADTYPAIDQVLADLQDNHSFFLTPQDAKLRAEGMSKGLGLLAVYPQDIVVQVYSGSAAEHAGIHVGDTIEMINGVPAQTLTRSDFSAALNAASITLTLTHREQAQTFSVSLQAGNYDANPKPHGQVLEGGLGYLELPQFGARFGDGASLDQYATLVQRLIGSVDQANTCGWVVDLRRNRGGNMWPMLAGVGPILGEGQVGSFVDADGHQTPWFYRNGQALLGQVMATQVDVAYHLKRAMPPVAVLTSQFTTSSGEAVVVAFRGRPHTSSFGDFTAGVPTANNSKILSDGAILNVTEALDADRTGQTYEQPIAADTFVQANWTQLDTAKDPVLHAATSWLHSQKECGS